ncbi:5-formyltetrahydrofolate cyclo-ligase [Nocardioides pantholopis]|uniref:5-formyltetrahydrofolate cyclo-ligase n=1 Tax=Nocardioides pantholopis TaxID=2483798 RepID=UPI000F088DFD|nr:5-formyltetrahydrofolate cyclo-ligase [Nocardioides pantholopis]
MTEREPSGTNDLSGGPAGKLALRDQLLTARHRRPLLEVGNAGRAIALHLLATPEVRRAASVAAYVSVGAEPGTGLLLRALAESGRRVLLPRLLPDRDLDWGTYRGDAGLQPARLGLLEPPDSLGVEAIATADVVLLPGLAASPHGWRLGRGGGSYDRALARVPAGTFTCVLLYDDEVGVPVPVEPHDRPVSAACSPAGLVRFPAPPPG